jgi:hypothetical protein
MNSWVELVTAIITAAGIIAGALKLLARALVRAIGDHAAETRALRAAVVDNTQAVQQNTAARETARHLMRRATPLLFVMVLLTAGCGTVDPLIIRAIERNRQVWEEDRRQDLDPELVRSRHAEFEAQLRYAKSK